MDTSIQQLVLITDFGYQDPYLGFLKSEIIHKCANLRMIDVSHNIPQSDISLAAYYTKGVLSFGRSGNIYLLAVNNYYDIHCDYVVMEKEGNFFIAPNNGILSLIFEDAGVLPSVCIDTSDLPSSRLEEIYSHAIACLHHKLPITEIGQPCDHLELKMMFHPVVTSSMIRATIIHVDSYENVITNLSLATFEKARNGRNFRIHYNPKDPVTKISEHYGQVPVGEVLCRFNDAQHLEIAINQGKASSNLHLYRNETIQIDFIP